MNAYNPLQSSRRLEETGLSRLQAEAIATEIGEGTNDLVTKDMLDAALDKQTIKIGALVAAIIVLACTVMGVIFSIK